MNIQQVTTIQSIKEATDTNLTFEITVLVKQIYRTDQGLNIFTVGDGKSSMKFVAFTKSGTAYGEITEGSVATFQVKLRTYEDKVQGTIQDAEVTKDPIRTLQLRKNILLTEYAQYTPKQIELLLNLEEYRQLRDSMEQAATLIRGAIATRRPILITHHADCDGYAAGLLLERAITAQIQHRHGDIRYLQNFIQRNPSKTPYYNLGDVTKDISFFQLNQQRAGTAAPLILIVDNGSTDQDLLAIKKASLFGADAIVIDHHDPGAKDENGMTPICHHTLSHVNPHLVGIKDNFSASMLCYQIASYIDELNEPSTMVASVGGIADKCDGNAIDHLVKLSKKNKQHYEQLAVCIDYEIFHTKFNHSTGSLYELFDGVKQKELMDLYQPILEREREQVTKSAIAYAEDKLIGEFNVSMLDGEATTLWGDYYSIGKLAALLHNSKKVNNNNQITLVYSNNIIVFRVQQNKDHHFDVNELLHELTSAINFARIDGGGHDVAGSIRFVKAAKNNIIEHINDYIARK